MLKLTDSFGNRCFLGLVAGILFGAYAPTPWIDGMAPVGTAFMQLLKMIVIPTTFVFIVNSFANLETVSKIKLIGGKTVFWFFFTAIVAASIGLATANLLNPASDFHSVATGATLNQPPAFSQIFLDMLPGNLFDQAARGKVVPIILFGVLFAIALTLGGEETSTVRRFFKEMGVVISKITTWIIRLSPIGIFVFIAQISAHYGPASLVSFAKFIATVFLACLLQFVVYSALLMLVARQNPVDFVRKSWTMMLTAFTTSSSIATLPVTINTLVNRLGVPQQIASFVAPLGANAKMDGCGAIYPAIVCVFTAALLQIPLDWQQYLVIVLTASLASIGTAGVPSSAIVTTMIVLSCVGLPFEGLAFVLGIDRIIDMLRTMTNVTGTAVCAMLVASPLEQEEKVPARA